MKKLYKYINIILITFLTIGFTICQPISANTFSILRNNIKQLNDAESNLYDLLIITPKEFEKALKPLQIHKENVGIRTRIINLQEAYDIGFWGRDNPEKIKLCIADSIENAGIKYVLLVGGMKGQTGKWLMPVRYVNLGNNWEAQIISDLYYADIYDSKGNFSTWDSDNDNNFEEWTYGDQPQDTHIDYYPDIAIGRLPCRNIVEVKIMVQKIINYEKTVYNSEWFNDIIAIAGDTYPEILNPKWVGYEGEYYADLAIENMSEFNAIRLYTSDGTLTHWKDILNSLNNGAGFVYFVGHGSPMTWSNHLPNNKTRIKGFKTYHMNLLHNKNKQFICVVSGCHNSQFDVNIFKFLDPIARGHIEYVPECFSWKMTRKIGGGSIATLGCTALGHTKEDKVSFKGGINELEVQFFHQYSQHNKDIIGDAWRETINWYLNTYPVDWNQELTNDSWVDVQVPQTWVLFGDPSLKIGGYQISG